LADIGDGMSGGIHDGGATADDEAIFNHPRPAVAGRSATARRWSVRSAEVAPQG
jgi:hypothetical protein